jgi:hypothetical protein
MASHTRSQTAADTRHEAELQAAFQQQQARRWAATDMHSSVLMTILMLHTLPTVFEGHGRQLLAIAAELLLLLMPAALSIFRLGWYLPRRAWIIAACRLLSAVVVGHAVPPLKLVPNGPWGGWLKFLAVTRTLSLIMFAFARYLPVKVRSDGLTCIQFANWKQARLHAWCAVLDLGASSLLPGGRSPAGNCLPHASVLQPSSS